MVMSYVGALKTWIYAPIFHFAGVNIWTVRLPMVLAGALTVFFFFKLTQRSAGPMAAVLAAFLLATDPSFLLTNTFDWGPVALQLLLLVTGCYFLVRFAQKTNNSMLETGLGFFLPGLGLWNKAILVWALFGLAVAGVAVFRSEIRRLATRRTVSIAIVAFFLGALPLVLFNIRHPNATLGENARVEAVNLPGQLHMIRMTLDGSGLAGFISAPDWWDNPRTPTTREGRAAQWIRDRAGMHHSTGFDYVVALAILAAPWWWKRSRAARFALVFLIAAAAAMAMTRQGGGAVHHTVLLWPFPQLLVAAVLATLPWRPLAALAGAAMVTMNLLVVNQYVLDLERNGAAGNFTDALFALSDGFPDPPPGARPLYIVDWGMMNTLALFHQGRLPLWTADGLFQTATPTEDDQAAIKAMLTDPEAIFIGHVPSRDEFTAVRKNLDRAAAALGRRKQMLRIIPDSNGRPVFEVFRFVQ